MHALSVQAEKHGAPILKVVNVQFHPLGMGLLVLFAQEVEFITTLQINVNVQVVKLIMDMFVLLIAQLVNSTMKLLRNVSVQVVNTGMVIFVSIVMVVKLGMLH